MIYNYGYENTLPGFVEASRALSGLEGVHGGRDDKEEGEEQPDGERMMA